jgi:adenylylsulfate kinase
MAPLRAFLTHQNVPNGYTREATNLVKEQSHHMIIWLIGMSGSGKTTIARELYSALKPKNLNLVYLDGDDFREMFRNDVDHTIDGRRKNAERISHTCQLLDKQGIHVIASVLSIFPKWQAWNRENFQNYFEIFLDIPLDVLIQRDVKGLYAGAASGNIPNVVGFDISFPPPPNPDLTIDAKFQEKGVAASVQHILKLIPNLNDTETTTCLETLPSPSDTISSNQVIKYTLADGDLLNSPNTYFYTPFSGAPFLDAWCMSRDQLLTSVLELSSTSNEPASTFIIDDTIHTAELLAALKSEYNANQAITDESKKWLFKLLQKFEVFKRIHGHYDMNFRAIDRQDHRNTSLYLDLAEVFELAWQHDNSLPFLNCLLKILDTISSLEKSLSEVDKIRLAHLVLKEKKHIRDFALIRGVLL